MSNNNPIGVFDSGLGGISVLNHLTSIMPNEQFIYVADSAYCPYGTKPVEYIQQRALRIVDWLLQKKVKLVVVACNTATAAAIGFLRKWYNIPFVGMEPAIKPAASLTKTNVVGVLATQNTFNGELFKETRQKYATHIQTIIQVGHGLVEIVENDRIDSPEALSLVSQYTAPMVSANADYIVLGCTHYPFLQDIIKQVAPSLNIIDPAEPVARRTLQLLEMYNLKSSYTEATTTQIWTTGDEKLLIPFANVYATGLWKSGRIDV